MWSRIDELSPRSLTDGDWIETKNQSPDGGIRLIQLADIGVGSFLDKSSRFITQETEIRLKCTRLAVGDVLIARLPRPIGRACILPDIGQPAITAVDVAILRTNENILAEYLIVALNASTTRVQIESYGKGATRFRVSTGHLRSVLLPLPPLAEQHRIVAKVDELMALCDRFEAICTVREDTRDRLTKASYSRLSVSDADDVTFQSHAQFAIGILPALITRANQVQQLRQTILDLAVRGKLVEQNTADEPALELLKRIATARKLALPTGRSIRTLPVSAAPNGITLSLPAGWATTQLSKLVRVLNGRAYKKIELLNSGTPVLRVGNLFTSKHWYYSNLELEDDKYCDEGDLIYAWSASFGPFIWKGPRVIFHYHIWKLSLFSEADIDKHFLYFFLLQKTQDIKAAGHGVSMVHMTKRKMEQLTVLIPPIEEQRRIVARVNELMVLCDQLEGSFVGISNGCNRFLKSALQKTLQPSKNEI